MVNGNNLSISYYSPFTTMKFVLFSFHKVEMEKCLAFKDPSESPKFASNLFATHSHLQLAKNKIQNLNQYEKFSSFSSSSCKKKQFQHLSKTQGEYNLMLKSFACLLPCSSLKEESVMFSHLLFFWL